MLSAQSCIVADPPEYRAPGRTRPVLNMYSAVPTATQALVVDISTSSNSATKFSVKVRSEDAGEPLRASFFLDYQIKQNLPDQRGEVLLVSKLIPASTYDNDGRSFDYTWTPAGTQGCHFLTLVVAHRDTFKTDDEAHLDPRYADDDAALVTWTTNVVKSVADGSTLANCPSIEKPLGP